MWMFAEALKQREVGNNLRFLVNNSALKDFSSNDYLGLAKSPQFKKSYLTKATELTQLGSTGSRLLTGNSIEAEELESFIARFHGSESATLCGSGYMANSGLYQALSSSKGTVLFDCHAHASTKAGIRLSSLEAFAFRHNNLDHLEEKLKKRDHLQPCFVAVESIYSTDGTIAPLEEIVSLTERYQCYLIVDEAHSVGIYGKEGRGLVYELGLMNSVFAHIVTFGKALGCYGAAILGNSLLKSLLINFSPTVIYSTSLPPLLLAAIKTSYELLPSLDAEREKLRQLILFFQKELNSCSSTPIQPFFIAGNEAVHNASLYLKESGFDVRALKSPTVQKGKERLRICLHSFNELHEAKKLIDCLKELQ